MKIKALIIGALAVAALHAAAQEKVISGIVTDQEGTPLVGARVDLDGCSEYTTTDFDGAFKFRTECEATKLTVRSAGMMSKTQKIEPNMVVKMSRSAWYSMTDRWHWLGQVQLGTTMDDETSTLNFGVMAAYIKDWGAYAKVMFHPQPSCDNWDDYSYGSGYSSYWGGEVKSKGGYASFTVGAVKHIYRGMYLYLGAGYVQRDVAYEMGDYTFKDDDESYKSVGIDLGYIVAYGRFSLTVGVTYAPAGGDADGKVNLSYGIGYIF